MWQGSPNSKIGTPPNNTVKKLTEKFSQLLVKFPADSAGLAGHAPVNDSTTVQLANLPNHSFSYFLIRSAFSNPHSAFEYANFFLDDSSFFCALHERRLGFLVSLLSYAPVPSWLLIGPVNLFMNNTYQQEIYGFMDAPRFFA